MINPSTKYSNSYFIFLAGIFLAGLVAALFSFYYWIIAIPFALMLFYIGWQQWQYVFFLLMLMLPWSIEYNVTGSLSTDLPDEPLMLLTTILCLLHFFNKPSEFSPAWKHPLIILLLIGIAWIIVTIFFSTDWIISLKFLAAKFWYLGAFVFTPVLLFSNKKILKTAALCLALSMFIITAFVMYKHYKSGLTFAWINDVLLPFFRNHVNYSAMLVCIVPLFIAIYRLHKATRMFVVLALVIILTALFFSYARGAWLALVVGLIAYWLMVKKKLLLAFIIAFVLGVVALFWIKSNDRYLEYAHNFKTTVFHKDFREHLVATYELKDVSTAERFNRWIGGVRMIKDRWATGYGPNTFYYNYKPYTVPAFKTWVSDNEERSTVHNYFLLTIIEQGVPGLVLFLLLLGAMFFYAEHLYNRVQDKLYKEAALACGVILSMIVVVNFLSDLVETDKVGSLFFLCLGTLVAIDLSTRSFPSHSKHLSNHSQAG